MSNVPRRLRRFQRQNNQENNVYENDYNPMPSFNKEPSFEENPRGLPTMDYEDLNIDEKNKEELIRIEQMNLEQKLALLEVEKFKKEKKRLPNKQETEKIADNLYLQFKEGSINQMPSMDEEITTGRSSRRLRHARQRGYENNKKNNINEKLNDTISMDENELQKNDKTNIKDLFATNNTPKKASKEDDFDLGLDLEDPTNKKDNKISELEEISEFGEETCPNCGKGTEVIYCSKCGTAYCKECAKAKSPEGYVCPKCGTKNQPF